jgi:hypothetical protein
MLLISIFIFMTPLSLISTGTITTTIMEKAATRICRRNR